MKWLTLAMAMLGGVAAQASDLADRLPAKPCGIGRPASDRGWWEALAKSPEGIAAVKRAEGWLKESMPAFDPQRYLDYTTNGDRTRYQAQHSRRWDRFKWLVLGECLESKGRFVPAIGETVDSLCADPSWVLPAHDKGASIFKGEEPYADLAAASNGYEMALASWLLEKSLPPEVVAKMRKNVAKRLTDPVFQTIDGTASKRVLSGHWWARANQNWNAVCTSGAIGAILVTEPSPEKRAAAINWAVRNMDVFLSGFGADGYCSEGVGYWNYGFGHFVVLEELLRAQTGGQVDLFKSSAVRTIAAAPALLELADGIYPAFADCQLTAAPDAHLVELVRWRLENRPFHASAAAALAEPGQLYQILTSVVARTGAAVAADGKHAGLPASSWFSDSGICVVRPTKPGGLAAAWKGGHNAEHHNHNDVGSTVVAWKGQPIIADPGAMVYRAETFSKDRYRLTVISSYAHSVPVIDGMLQAEGARSKGKVLETCFNDRTDTVTIDLSSAYPGSAVKKLERQWTFDRTGDGVLTMEDRMSAEKPITFATALVGLGDWYLLDGGDRTAQFQIDGGKGAVLQVEVVFSQRGRWAVQRIENPGKRTATRLGLSLVDATSEGSIRMTIRAAEHGLAAAATQLAAVKAPEKLDDARKE